MTEKRFHKGDWSNNICEVYDNENYIGGVQLDCADEFIDLLNSLNEENEQLKARIEHLERKIQRERTSAMKQHEKWENEIQKENKELKAQLKSEHQQLENAILLERTRMGKNSLIQYKEAIQ